MAPSFLESELWLVDLAAAGTALEADEAAAARLSTACEEDFARMALAGPRHERRLAHIALRVLLERWSGPAIRGRPLERSPTGKPSLPGATASFSLAHAPGLALVALAADGPIGADIERERMVRMPEIRRAPIEAAAVALANGASLGEGNADARFVRAWVRIEAIAKAGGTGVAPLLEGMRPGRERHAAGLVEEVAGSTLVAHDVSAGPGLFAAVALAAGREAPVIAAFPDTVAGIAALLARPPGTSR
jgi:4'-phosphopantetheinyl transferase